MNIERSNLYNILSAIIVNQSLLKSQLSNTGKEVFYIDDFNETPIVSGLYIDKKGETRFWNGSKWDYVSKEVINEITSNSTDETIPTSKAVYDLVDSRTSGSVSDGVINEINLSISSISGDLINVSGDVEQLLIDVENLKINGGRAELFYVSNFNDFTETNKPTISGLYIDHDGETRFWNGTEWEYTSKNVVSTIDNSTINSDVDIVPSVKAVYDYVNNKIENIEFPEGGTPEIFYIESFENNPSVSGLYINHNGETRFWNGTEWEYTSNEITDEITEPDEDKIPSVKAVYDYVNDKIENIEFPEGGKPEVFYIESFDGYSATVSGLYIDESGQSRFWNGAEWENTSCEVTDEITEQNVNENQIPSVKAVYDFVTSKIENIEVSGGGKPEVFYVETFAESPEVSGFYIDYDGETRFWNGAEWKDISHEITDEVSEKSEGLIVPTAKAVYDFVVDKTSNFITTSTLEPINSSVTSLLNDVDYLKRNTSEVFYVGTFKDAPEVSGLYINHDGETRFWNGTEWEYTSQEVIDEIKLENNNLVNEEKITSVKAVYNFVKSEINKIENPGSTPSTGEGKPEVFYVETFAESPEVSGLYINHNGETRFWTGSVWEYTSNEIIDEITESNENQIPSVKAVYDFVNDKTSSIDGINEQISNISGEIDDLKNNASDGKDEVFYIDSDSFPSNPESPGLYIINTGESQYYRGEEGWEKTSYEVIDEVNENGSETVSTSKAVYDFVKSEINKIEIPEPSPSTGDSKPEVFYIESFEGYSAPVSGFYIDYKGETRFWTGSDWEKTSCEVTDEITNPDENKIPSVKAVYNYVNSKIENNGSNEGSNTSTGGGLPEVFYVETFTESPEVSGFYIDHDGETRFWNGEEWEYTSHEITDEITESFESLTVPTSKAVYNFVKSQLEDFDFQGSGSSDEKPEIFYCEVFPTQPVISGLYIKSNGEFKFWNGNSWVYTKHNNKVDEINSNSTNETVPSTKAVYDFVNSKIENNDSSSSNNGGKPEVFYVETFAESPEVSGFYIDHDGETRFWSGTEWEYTSHEITDEINDDSMNGTVPSTKAVYNFVIDRIGNNGSNASSGEGKSEIFYIDSFINYVPSVSGLYIDKEGQSKFWGGEDWEVVSREVVNEISSSSLSSTIPSTKAVYDFVLENLGNGSGSAEVFYIESFEDYNAQTSGLYIDHEGETRFWSGTEWEYTSQKITEIISEESTDDEIPTSKAVFDLVTASAGSKFIYFDIPDESQIDSENGNLLLIEIDFSNDDDFSEKLSFTLSDCQVFNPATGNWIECPADGLDIAVANSKIRISKQSGNYLNCRYRWKTTNGDIGSYKTAII
jgi:hypothetical protein